MSRNSHWIDLDTISRQLTALRREVAGSSRALARHGGHAAHDVGDQLWHQGEVMARQFGKQAKRAGRAVQKDPAPAVAAIVGFACLMSLVMARKRG